MKMDVSVITHSVKGTPCQYSGYERLIDFLKLKTVYCTINFPRLKIIGKCPLRTMGLISRFYDSIETAEIFALRDSSRILHHLYGENTFFLSGLKPFKGNKKVVVTFHLPETRFTKVMPFYWKKLAKNADYIILLSPCQHEFFTKELGNGNIFLVPHGIDTEYFTPREKRNSCDGFCLSVGDHLRDYRTLLEAMKILSYKVPKLKLVIVSNQIDEIKQKNLVVMRSISDEKLLELYHSSSFLVLPVNQGTASNTLLEGMACGLPLVTTRTFTFYTQDKGCLYYSAGDAVELAESMIKLANSPDLRKKLGAEARERAEELAWNKIAKEIMKIYERL